jgi:uncharacterized LabA/DUF88 family protein
MKISIDWKRFGKVMIAIDAANIEHSAKDLNMHIRYQKLIDFFKKQSNFLQINFYSARFNSKSHDRFLTFLKKQGFKLVTKPIKIIQDYNKGELRKADFDVEITADVMDKIAIFDTLILFSGDSDFDYLIKLLKAKGKRVIVISSRYHVSRELIASCTRYLDLKKFKEIFLTKQKN